MRLAISILPLLLAASACSRAAAEPPRVLELLEVLPKDGQGVLLNEPLDFYFSGPVARSSVVAGIRVFDSKGREAAGKLEVDGANVRFQANAALAPDLSDGGLQPGERYEVELRGFPRPDSLRGADGEPLARTYRWVFRTVGVGDGPLFVDDKPDQPATLRFATPTVAPDEPIVFLADEPIDPTSLSDGIFRLYSLDGAEDAAPYPVRVRLVRELSPRTSATRGQLFPGDARGALLEVEPRITLEPGRYRLEWSLAHGVRDYSGAAALISGISTSHVEVEVTDVLPGARGLLVEPFLDASLRSPVPVPGADGTAYWGFSGRVEVRSYPAAAGDGSDGEVVLGEAFEGDDLSAVSLDVPEDTTTALQAEGLVVLRSQGRLTVKGDLLRRTGVAVPDLVTRRPFDVGGTLTDWLARTRETGVPWTVLVAGGDVVIEGRVIVDAPLLLVAGGTVRISGEIANEGTEIYATVDDYMRKAFRVMDVTPVRGIEIDEPRENLLQRPLRYAVLSAPLPQRGIVSQWLSTKVRGQDKNGSFTVRYISGDLPPEEAVRSAVADPRFLDGGTLRILVELEVFHRGHKVFQHLPRVSWDPPFVDDVQLVWN